MMSAKIVSFLAVAGLLVGSSTIGFAANYTSVQTPGYNMQNQESVKGSYEASGAAQRHVVKKKKTKAGSPGASGSAPSPSTGGSGGSGYRY